MVDMRIDYNNWKKIKVLVQGSWACIGAGAGLKGRLLGGKLLCCLSNLLHPCERKDSSMKREFAKIDD